MFTRIKNIRAKNGNMHSYLYLVDSKHTKEGSRQRVKKYLGRVKHLSILRKETIQSVFKKYNYQCALCYSQENLVIDHIIPLSKGGTNDIFNLQVLCKECNLRKRDLIYHTPKFRRKLQIENLVCTK